MFSRSFYAGLTLVFASTGCGSGGGAGSPAVAVNGPPAPLAVPTFRIVVPVVKTPAATVRPKYVGAGALSVNITLNTVDGGTPPVGLETSVTTNIASGSCATGCTISGPAVPPGTDAFSVTTFNAMNAGGSAIAQTAAAQAFTVTAGADNGPFAITLSGIPKSFSFGAMAAGAAGTASSPGLSIAVLDVDGNPITGNYARPVTLSDSDASADLTNGTSLRVGSGAPATSVTIGNDTDAAAVTFGYGGLAMVSPTLTLHAAGAAPSSNTFTVALHPIVVSQAEIDLYASSGTGSSGSFLVSEAGWSNAPYSRSFALGTPTCSTGTAAATFSLSTSNNLTWTDTMPASAAAGNCSVPLVDFTGSGHPASITLTATTGSFTVN